MIKRLYQIDTGYACAGVIVNADNIVIQTAPIFRWMIGKPTSQIKKWKKIKAIRYAGSF